MLLQRSKIFIELRIKKALSSSGAKPFLHFKNPGIGLHCVLSSWLRCAAPVSYSATFFTKISVRCTIFVGQLLFLRRLRCAASLIHSNPMKKARQTPGHWNCLSIPRGKNFLQFLSFTRLGRRVPLPYPPIPCRCETCRPYPCPPAKFYPKWCSSNSPLPVVR